MTTGVEAGYNRPMMTTLIRVLIAGTLLCALGWQEPADLILFNGKVFTADSANSYAEAVAIRGERIIAVGTSQDINKLAGRRTRRVDVQGRIVIPGINDAHFHFEPDAKGFDLKFDSMEPSWEQTAAAIQQAVKQAPPGSWIFGAVGSGIVMNEQVNRAALDRLAPDHPVLLRSYYGHGYIINSKAMPLLDIQRRGAGPGRRIL
jgi:predicted amidohydrolase YtcJ